MENLVSPEGTSEVRRAEVAKNRVRILFQSPQKPLPFLN